MNDADYAFENIRVKAISLGIWDYIEDVVRKEADRVYFQAEVALHYKVKGSHLFQRTPVGEDHRHWLKQTFAVPANGTIYSYREAKRPSLQVTVFDRNGSCYGEMDIDLSSPLMDVWGFIVHTVEVLTPGLTNHRKLRAKLMKDPELKKYFA